jgi:hypothetical protein
MTCRGLFADDCFLYREIDGKEYRAILQKDLEYLEKWAATCVSKQKLVTSYALKRSTLNIT